MNGWTTTRNLLSSRREYYQDRARESSLVHRRGIKVKIGHAPRGSSAFDPPEGESFPGRKGSSQSVSRILFLSRRKGAPIYLITLRRCPLAGVRLTRDHRTGRPVPYSVLHRTGFLVPPRSPSERWALTPPFHPYPSTSSGRFLFCDTFRRTGLEPRTPPLSERVLPCGVRTFLSRANPEADASPWKPKASCLKEEPGQGLVSST